MRKNFSLATLQKIWYKLRKVSIWQRCTNWGKIMKIIGLATLQNFDQK